MIIFFGEGRLGNQLFQYAFIKNFLKRGERLVTYNFKEFLEIFDTKDNIQNIKNKYIQHILRFIVVPVLKVFSYLRVISSYEAKKIIIKNLWVENGEYKYRKGLFSVVYVFPGYFQSEMYFNKRNVADIKIKKEYTKKAEKFLKGIPDNRKKIFVHIRRRDYITHRCFDKRDISLPLNYYKDQIKEFNSEFRNIIFIFLSDDIDYVKKNFKEVKNKIISTEDMNVDFSIMTLCDGGIMSNSTYSWWAGYFAKGRKNIVAPRYWFGFKSNIEFPRGITPSFAEVVNCAE